MRAFLPVFAVMAGVSLQPAAAQETTLTPQDSDDAVTVSHGYAIIGDLKLPADFKHLPYVNPEAPKGGYIVESVPNTSNFDNFNPFTFKGRPAVFSAQMLETLMGRDSSDFGASYCLLCETLEYPESRDWVIFHLRPEARFASGNPVTADDVVFSVEAMRDDGSTGTRLSIQQQIAKVEAIDDLSVKFSFVEGYPRREVVSFVGGLPIMSRADFEERGLGLDETMDKPLIGSGPYALTGWSMGRWVEVTRRDDYWGADLPLNIGRNNFDRMRYEYFADYDAAFQAFTAGEYTFRRENSSIKWATAYDFPAQDKGWVKVETMPDNGSVSGQAWVFNLRREKFQDARVRHAIGLMFNFQWINDKMFYGLYARPDSYWENQPLEAEGMPTEGELALLEPLRADLPDAVFTEEAYVWPVGNEQPRDRRAMRQAGALLDEAGWTIGDGGMRRNADGEVLSVEFLNDSVTLDRILNPYIESLRSIGIDAVNARVDNAELESRERAHDFDITSAFMGQSPIPGAEMLPVFGSEFATSESNLIGLKNPAIDKLMKDVEHAQTQEEMETASRALDRSLRAMFLTIPQWYNSDHWLAYYDMYAHPEELPAFALGQMDFWWFLPEREAKLKAEGALR
ncbi:extracellular solute-binding protein [Paracoccus tegillarcae]|uniref:ABC transporter substrate-binding protein n=1 Tax=Paracoccus tegillarcae TaxID=1529068 RepID=A0A2K9ERS9_9RHOB|nr:extracellular solute-binding protein [Paracoccus tegillarcae]AUH34415.1 ABC transporter substrate-binding protein [Paracoccus tegillarcae]